MVGTVDLPRVVGNDQLQGEDGGGPCEICQEEMKYHEWALLDENGKALFCSMLTFVDRDLPEVFTTVKYKDMEDDTFTWGATSDPERLTITAVNNAKAIFADDEEAQQAEVFVRRSYIFNGPKMSKELIN
jgi:hypothetical protein